MTPKDFRIASVRRAAERRAASAARHVDPNIRCPHCGQRLGDKVAKKEQSR